MLVKLPVCNETNFSSTPIATEMLTVEKAQYNSFTEDRFLLTYSTIIVSSSERHQLIWYDVNTYILKLLYKNMFLLQKIGVHTEGTTSEQNKLLFMFLFISPHGILCRCT